MGGICYVNFSGDCKVTACGEDPERVTVTLFMSAATCLGCQRAIRGDIEKLRPKRAAL